MAAVTPSGAILEKLQSDVDLEIDVAEHADQIVLAPHLVLAVSLLYMMACDGSIEDEESSQLQASLGGHENLLQFALRYVQVVTVDRFLQKAPEVLSAQDKLCILSNVCDSMLSDGQSEPAELALFSQFVAAFGLNQGGFDTYFNTIALKNDKSVLGPFEPLQISSPKMTPHLALAASLLYMMTADGSIGQEEIGQLEAVLGEFEGLQKVALTYVRAVKRAEFLKLAPPLLSESQKLYILTNVCDSMLADGNVAVLEDKLFVSMLAAFGFSENTFQPYYQVIEAKNIKPFDTSKFKLSTQHTRLMSGDASQGEVFDNIVSDGQNIQKVKADNISLSDQPVLKGEAAKSGMGSLIHRTMQDNIANVNQDFGSNENIVKVGRNATDQLNVQEIDRSAGSAHLQQLATEGSTGDNLQRLNVDHQADKRASIAIDSAQANKQTIDDVLYATYGAPAGSDRLLDNVQEVAQSIAQANVQALALDPPAANQALLDAPPETSDHLEILPAEVRLQNLFEDIDMLNRKLDVFEEKNKSMLAAAKKAREESKRREAQALAVSLNRQNVHPSQVQPNLQSLGKEGMVFNVQPVAIDRLESHDPKVPMQARTSLVRLDASTPQSNTAIMVGPQNEAGPAIAPLPLSFLSAAQLTATDDPAKSAKPNLRKRKAGHHGGGSAATGASFKVYVKATVTFVVLSCWASSISAVDTVRNKPFVGVLEKSPVAGFVQSSPQLTE